MGISIAMEVVQLDLVNHLVAIILPGDPGPLSSPSSGGSTGCGWREFRSKGHLTHSSTASTLFGEISGWFGAKGLLPCKMAYNVPKEAIWVSRLPMGRLL
jgi:hypothetical protein